MQSSSTANAACTRMSPSSRAARWACTATPARTETYYLLSGEGLYHDNDKSYPVKAGDVTFCADGGTHGLDNTGDSDLTFMALIIKK